MTTEEFSKIRADLYTEQAHLTMLLKQAKDANAFTIAIYIARAKDSVDEAIQEMKEG